MRRVVFLGRPDGSVRAQRFDANRPATTSRTLGPRRDVGERRARDRPYYFVPRRRSAPTTTSRTTRDSRRNVLILSALNSEGEVGDVRDPPFERDEDCKVTVGRTDPSDTIAVTFNEFRELWGLPLVSDDD